MSFERGTFAVTIFELPDKLPDDYIERFIRPSSVGEQYYRRDDISRNRLPGYAAESGA